MKMSCPKCQKVLQAPDDWAGRKVRCPACKESVQLPAAAPPSTENDLRFDLESLGKMEAAGEPVIRETKGKPLSLKEAQALAATQSAESGTTPAKVDPTIRTCPSCKQKVKATDLYSEVMCRHCGAGIPGQSLQVGQKAQYQDSMALRMKADVTFYSGFTTAAAYPIPALGSIGLGMAIALASIAVPLLAVLGFIASAGLNPINEKPGGIDYGWVGIFITSAFAAQTLYFGSVGYYILIDSIRTTTSGAEQPPNLTWNVINLGAALGGYAALLGLYLVVTIVLVSISQGFPTKMSDFGVLSEPANLIVLALITFGVPMNMIGLSSSHALDGLNPVQVTKSILQTAGHYIFLFLVSLLYLGIYVGIMAAVLNWAGPKILAASREGLGAGLGNMLLGLVAWAVVMGAGFYFAYSMGRILGLFARTYREKLDFEL